MKDHFLAEKERMPMKAKFLSHFSTIIRQLKRTQRTFINLISWYILQNTWALFGRIFHLQLLLI